MGKGEGLIVVNAGCASEGFHIGCDLAFPVKTKENKDYHTEMNGKVFLEWEKN